MGGGGGEMTKDWKVSDINVCIKHPPILQKWTGRQPRPKDFNRERMEPKEEKEAVLKNREKFICAILCSRNLWGLRNTPAETFVGQVACLGSRPEFQKGIKRTRAELVWRTNVFCLKTERR